MKRAANILFAIYIVFLSGWPCQDHGDALLLQSEAMVVVLDGACDADQSDNDDAGRCSPLCGCSCCSLVMEEVEISFFVPWNSSVLGCKPSVNLSWHPYMLSSDVWRPPVISV